MLRYNARQTNGSVLSAKVRPAGAFADAGFDYSASFPPASGSAGMCDGSPDSRMNVMLGISASML